MNQTQIYLLSALAILATVFCIEEIRLRKKFKKLFDQSIGLALEYMDMHEHLQNLEREKELQKDEDFVTFLSNTRNSAFEYIENTQAILKEFDQKINEIKDWLDTYGILESESVSRSKLINILSAYEKVKNILPQGEVPNN